MNAFQARMFIEQILAQPSVPAAAQLVQANVRFLDETFFLVLGQLIQSEQSPPLGSWGDSFEDRLAEGMARINSPTPPSQRLQALQTLHDYALQLCQQQAMADLIAPAPAEPPVLPAAAVSPPRGAARGFDYWMNELKKMGAAPAPAEATPAEPASDLEKAQRLMEIDRHYLPLMAEIMPGRASADTIVQLEALCADYEQLERLGPPTHPFYTARDIRGKVADVLESIARSHDSLNHAAEAHEHYRRASAAWTEAGNSDNAQRCDAARARLRLSTEGNVDEELRRLQAVLAATPPGSLKHVQTLVELAELQSGGGDDFAAEELLLQARDEMARLGHAAPSGPSGGELANALEASLRGILAGETRSGPSPIEIQMLARGLQRRILVALGQVCRESDPERAAGYLREAKQMDSTAENEAFSNQMLASLNALFGGQPPPPRNR